MHQLGYVSYFGMYEKYYLTEFKFFIYMFQIMRNDEKWILYNMKCKKLNELLLTITNCQSLVFIKKIMLSIISRETNKWFKQALLPVRLSEVISQQKFSRKNWLNKNNNKFEAYCRFLSCFSQIVLLIQNYFKIYFDSSRGIIDSVFY